MLQSIQTFGVFGRQLRCFLPRVPTPQRPRRYSHYYGVPFLHRFRRLDSAAVAAHSDLGDLRTSQTRGPCSDTQATKPQPHLRNATTLSSALVARRQSSPCYIVKPRRSREIADSVCESRPLLTPSPAALHISRPGTDSRTCERSSRRLLRSTTPSRRGETVALQLILAALAMPSRPVMDPDSQLDSDISSIVSTSSRPMASDTDDAPEADTFKYRLPDQTKTRAHPRSIPVPATAGRGNGNNSNNSSGRSPISPDYGPPPTPPPKDDTPSAVSATGGFDPTSYFNPYNMSRAGSVYTLSRVSFTSQISQLTSINLPDADTLAANIAAIPSASAAARVLNDAAEQIRRWIKKASEVLKGLEAEDDVEWAAAAGREGLAEVDAAIQRFETLILVYVEAIEKVQTRPDVHLLRPQEVQVTVDRMESILNEWEGIKKSLSDIKSQVELAMEWEELWNTVLGEIGAELEALGRMIFEMEERRHKAVMMDVLGEGVNKLDIKELETIVEEAPGRANGGANNRLTMGVFPPKPPRPDGGQEETEEKDDARLLQLVARMQPLRASLDFLPMRLASWENRGGRTFPTAVDDLDRRRTQLEEKYEKLNKDAADLRDELGEDRWVMIFRNAGRSALAMCNSVSRTMTKLRDGLEEGEQYSNQPAMSRKIQMYEEKKIHYSNGIESVLKIFEKGVNDRLTVNGEILNLQKECQERWAQLTAEMKGMDFVLSQKEMNGSKTNLRDSISTILSADRSFTSSAVDTPGSSPASSVIVMSRKSSEYGHFPPNGVSTPSAGRKSRQGSTASSSRTHLPSMSRRHSSLPVKAGANYGQGYVSPYSQRAIATQQRSASVSVSEASTSPSMSPRFSNSSTPTPGNGRLRSSPSNAELNKPRWNSSTNMRDTVVGHNFKPSTPSNRKDSSSAASTAKPALRTARSAIPIPSPLATSSNRPPSSLGSAASTARPPSHSRTSSAASNRAPSRLGKTEAAWTPSTPGTASKLTSPRVRPSASATANGSSAPAADETPSRPRMRSASAMGGRRSSLLPMPRRTSGKLGEEASAKRPWR